MLRPSYSDILEVITQDSEDITIASRYTIVIAAAKRARQLVDHQQNTCQNQHQRKRQRSHAACLFRGGLFIHDFTSFYLY